VELDKHYKKKESVWRDMAIKADRAADDACEDSPEPDDVVPYLTVALEIKQEFIDAVGDSSARSPKKWAGPFAEYVLKFQWVNVLQARKER